MLLQTILFGDWFPPEVKEIRRHSMLGTNKKASKEPVHARSKIMSVLKEEDWMTNKEIAKLTELQLNTVQTTTNKLFTKGKIERMTKKDKSDIKPICLYRKK